MMKAPCKDCPDRHVGCHSECERYVEYADWREAEREKHAQRKREADVMRVGLIKNLKKHERKLQKR